MLDEKFLLNLGKQAAEAIAAPVMKAAPAVAAGAAGAATGGLGFLPSLLLGGITGGAAAKLLRRKAPEVAKADFTASIREAYKARRAQEKAERMARLAIPAAAVAGAGTAAVVMHKKKKAAK